MGVDLARSADLRHFRQGRSRPQRGAEERDGGAHGAERRDSQGGSRARACADQTTQRRPAWHCGQPDHLLAGRDPALARLVSAIHRFWRPV
jgi:hypothetical protein